MAEKRRRNPQPQEKPLEERTKLTRKELITQIIKKPTKQN